MGGMGASLTLLETAINKIAPFYNLRAVELPTFDASPLPSNHTTCLDFPATSLSPFMNKTMH